MERKRYILLPEAGYRLSDERSKGMFASITASQESLVLRRPGSANNDSVRVLGRVSQDGPRLIECTAEAELTLRQDYGTAVRLVPTVVYERPKPFERLERSPIHPGVDSGTWDIRLVDLRTGAPIPGALVVAFTRFRWREGDSDRTDANGMVRLQLNGAERLERLYIYPPESGYWGLYRAGVEREPGLEFALQPIDLTSTNTSLAQFRGNLPTDAGRGVRVGIIDTGLDASHPGLRVGGGRNLVFDETAIAPHLSDDFMDTDGHGTHVAGIVAATPQAGSLVQGIAPGVELRGYRVFPRAGGGALNFDIMKAIEVAVRDGCHIINLSLGGSDLDEAVRASIADAQQRGVLAVCAAGNDGREPVSFPAANEYALAVSAIGTRDHFPAGSVEEADVARPFSTIDPGIFLSSFTNVGPQIKLTAPGVGIVSTVPGGYAPMSGTSMAAPMITGLAAAVLSTNPQILQAADRERVVSLTKELYALALPLGLGKDHEGYGLPLPEGPWRENLLSPGGGN